MEDLMSANNDKESRPRSGGPRTLEGRERSSNNSRRHGILSEKIVVLQSESQDDYRQLRRSYYEELRPVGIIEKDLVDDMVWAKWRQLRAMTVETGAIDKQMDDQKEYWEDRCPTVDCETRTAHAIKTLVDESNDLQHLSRYETRFHRMYHRSLRLLVELQERRRRDGQAIEPPEAEKQNLPNEQPSTGSKPPTYRARNDFPVVVGRACSPPPVVCGAGCQPAADCQSARSFRSARRL
jgi:hypothetical protein